MISTIYKSIQTGKILSCHDISEGGLIAAVFEMCVGGNMGAQIVIPNLFRDLRLDFFLFNETAGCFIVELENEKLAEKLFKNIPFTILGVTQKEKKIDVFKNTLF